MTFTPEQHKAIETRRWQYLGELAELGCAIGDEQNARDVLSALMTVRSQDPRETMDQLPDPVAKLFWGNYHLKVKDDVDKAALRAARQVLTLSFANLVRGNFLDKGNDSPTMGDVRTALTKSSQGPARAALELVFVPQPSSESSGEA